MGLLYLLSDEDFVIIWKELPGKDPTNQMARMCPQQVFWVPTTCCDQRAGAGTEQTASQHLAPQGAYSHGGWEGSTFLKNTHKINAKEENKLDERK